MARVKSAAVRAPARRHVPLVGKIKTYLETWRSILLLARRPDESEFNLLLKLNLLGFTLVGGIGYIIHITYVLLTS